MIVTRNLRDFPTRALDQWGVEAKHPDDFLAHLHETDPMAIGGIVTAIASAWRNDATAEDVLNRLAVDAPRAAAAVRQRLRNRP